MIPQVQLEVDILYKLNHPNIIKLYTHFEDEESIYLVLEYADQGTLLDLMRKQVVYLFIFLVHSLSIFIFFILFPYFLLFYSVATFLSTLIF